MEKLRFQTSFVLEILKAVCLSFNQVIKFFQKSFQTREDFFFFNALILRSLRILVRRHINKEWIKCNMSNQINSIPFILKFSLFGGWETNAFSRLLQFNPLQYVLCRYINTSYISWECRYLPQYFLQVLIYLDTKQYSWRITTGLRAEFDQHSFLSQQ